MPVQCRCRRRCGGGARRLLLSLNCRESANGPITPMRLTDGCGGLFHPAKPHIFSVPRTGRPPKHPGTTRWLMSFWKASRPCQHHMSFLQICLSNLESGGSARHVSPLVPVEGIWGAVTIYLGVLFGVITSFSRQFSCAIRTSIANHGSHSCSCCGCGCLLWTRAERLHCGAFPDI